MSDDNPPNAAVRTAGKLSYPYLVIRIFAAVYQRERLKIREGPAAVELVYRHCFVQHPAPFAADGTLNPDCRELLIDAVQAAVRRLGFRMWIVWARSSATSIEAERITSTGEPSNGSAPFQIEFTPQHYIPNEPLPDGAQTSSG
jgi:hypothetical protein